jgi:phage gp29-like protein
MSRKLVAYIDRVVDASMAPAAKAMAPVVRAVQEAVASSDGYEAADAALKRLEGKTMADRLEPLLAGAMMLGTSAGSVQP